MSGNIYIIADENQLVEMVEKPYDSEDVLQGLLANYPNLLAGEQMDLDNPRRWLLIMREAPISDGVTDYRWSLDHLFLDQEGIPTLVEVKRSENTQIRREVVGQMLDYAANAVQFWPTEYIRDMFEKRCGREGKDPEQAFAEALGPEISFSDYWDKVKTNLRAGRLRMIFVADVIPPELRRIIEFLDSQVETSEVVGVEVKKYQGKLKGKEILTLVPRLIGKSSTERQKGGGDAHPKKKWNEKEFLEKIHQEKGEDAARIARQILNWVENKNIRIWWGEGRITGSLYPLVDVSGKSFLSFAIWTNGTAQIQFGPMRSNPAFQDELRRLELLEKLNQVPGMSLPANSLDKYPSFPLNILANEKSLATFLGIWDWFFEETRKAVQTPGNRT